MGHHGHLSRKKRLPAAGVTITLVFVPSSVGAAATDTQLVVFRSVFSWRLNSVWVVGQTMATAALAAAAPLATLAAVWPPKFPTAVAPCVPVTSPASEPEKLLAVVAA